MNDSRLDRTGSDSDHHRPAVDQGGDHAIAFLGGNPNPRRVGADDHRRRIQ
jgi:hypothetical protein